MLFYDFEKLASYLYSVNKHFLLFGGNRETVTSVWNVAHDWCQLCAQCLLGGGRLYEKTIRKGISPIAFEVTVSLLLLYNFATENVIQKFFISKSKNFLIHLRSFVLESRKSFFWYSALIKKFWYAHVTTN